MKVSDWDFLEPGLKAKCIQSHLSSRTTDFQFIIPKQNKYTKLNNNKKSSSSSIKISSSYTHTPTHIKLK